MVVQEIFSAGLVAAGGASCGDDLDAGVVVEAVEHPGESALGGVDGSEAHVAVVGLVGQHEGRTVGGSKVGEGRADRDAFASCRFRPSGEYGVDFVEEPVGVPDEDR